LKRGRKKTNVKSETNRSPDDSSQGVPRSIIEPVKEWVEAIVGQVVSSSIVEPYKKKKKKKKKKI